MTCAMRALSSALLVMMLASSCGESNDDQLTVMAASSLTDVFEELVDAFASTEAGADNEIQLVIAGSSRLATQLEEGAPADVVATADEATMGRIERSGRLAGTPRAFASNALVVAQQRDIEPVDSLDGLADSGMLVAMCAEQVPCGALTHTLLSRAGVSIVPATREPNVRSVLTKVVLGEVDAGFVYTTDALAAGGDITTFVPPGSAEVVNVYPIATLGDRADADAFMTFVLTDGQEILDAHGFGRVPE